MARSADEMKMTGMTIGGLEAEAALAEIDLSRDARANGPLERAVDGSAADPRRFAADQIEQIVSAEVPFLAALAKEHLQNAISLAGMLAACRRQARKIGKSTVQISLRGPSDGCAQHSS